MRALVTGGLGGLGAACAQRLVADGVDVELVDLSDSADHRLDVTDWEAMHGLAGSIAPVDIVINAAGVVGATAPLWALDERDWHQTIAVSLTGTFVVCHAFVPAMIGRGWGRIVNFASMAGKDGNAEMAAYSAAKAGVIALTKSLGKELARTGVLANVVVPSVIATPMSAGINPKMAERISGLIPMGRPGRPDEVAELVAWLTSARCSFSTGAVYDISGGRATY